MPSADILPLQRSLPLISEGYRALQVELHKQRHDYGVASLEYAPFIITYLSANRVTEVLDYGCGKGRLGAELRNRFGSNITVHNYDPAIPEFRAKPGPCDTVTCIDVLEHIEPELLENVLDDLRRVTGRTLICTVHTGPASKTLSDGRNAHLIQRPPELWLPPLMARFRLIEFRALHNGFWAVLGAK